MGKKQKKVIFEFKNDIMLELAGIVILGILAQWISWKIKIPAILPLILIGLFFGPLSSLITEDGHKWIEPIFSEKTPSGLFPEKTFFYFVSLSIGLILFEGGLTLKVKEFRTVGSTILRLITIGPLLTLVLGAVFAYYVMNLNWEVSFMFSSLITVTGPTVIAPILRNLPLKRNTATILRWEGILIDPIGAIIAVLIFQFILTGESGEPFTFHALSIFLKIILIAVSFGFTAAHFLKFLVHRKLIPHYLLNVFTLALTLSVFVFSDLLAKESGLLAVVTMGLVLGNLNVPNIKGILDFKESISVLLISILFIILSARIDIEHIQLLFDMRVLYLFLLVVFVIRPLAVMFSSSNSKLSFNERIYISLTGPRGIVAAGIASLFGIRLAGITEDSEYITPLVFMVVLGTVIFSSLTGRVLAKVLRVLEKRSEGFMIIGAHSGARLLAKYLEDNNKHVVLLDNSQAHIDIAKKNGLTAFNADVYSENFNEDFEFLDIGYLLALTPSSDLNKYVLKKYREEFGENGSYRLITDIEFGKNEMLSKDCAFSCMHDYNILAEIGRDYPYIHEYELESKEHFQKSMKVIMQQRNSMPLFINDKKGSIKIIPSDINSLQVKSGDILVYIGKKLEELTIS